MSCEQVGYMERINKKQLGDRIRELRTAAGHTQDDLAELLEQKRQVVSYYENGTRMPNIEQIMTIAKEYNTTTDYLLGLTDVATTDKDIQFVCDYTGLNENTLSILNKYGKGSSGLAKSYNNEIINDYINNFILKNFDLITVYHINKITLFQLMDLDYSKFFIDTVNNFELLQFRLNKAFMSFINSIDVQNALFSAYQVIETNEQ